MFIVIWKYEVRPKLSDAFVAAYAPDGEWANLFRRSDEFLGVELLEDDSPGGYTTIDRWRNEDAWRAFMNDHAAAYRDLDRRLDHLTITEQLVSRGPTIDRTHQ